MNIRDFCQLVHSLVPAARPIELAFPIQTAAGPMWTLPPKWYASTAIDGGMAKITLETSDGGRVYSITRAATEKQVEASANPQFLAECVANQLQSAAEEFDRLNGR